jgi:ParB family chromosome partitioning protein
MNIQMIPLDQLVASRANVRKTGASLGIDELAASIAAHGLLQNLQVRPAAKGKFEVVAGGRRLAALKALAKAKRIAKDFETPCHVLEGEDAGEISLAENVVRLAMHPADQFTAFHALAESGKGMEEIAARFGVTASVVRQRLKLAGVSPRLMEVYRADEMSLDQLMAFTVSDDPAAQEAAWFDQPEYNRSPSDIRETLTAAQVEAGDRRVRLIGLDAYLAAGGGMNRDLFQPEHEGYLTDPALLDRLVAERLEAEAASVRAEGWAWVEIMPRLDYATLHRFGRVYTERTPLSDEQQEEQDRLVADYEALIEEYGEDPEPDIADRLQTLSDQIDAIGDCAAAWRDEDLALAGVVIALGYHGEVEIERGLVRAGDKAAQQRMSRFGDGEDEAAAVPPDPSASLSASLIASLTAERTAALRATMIDNEMVGLAAVAHALALPVFYGPGERVESCLGLRLTSRNLEADAKTIEQGGAAVLIVARHEEWRKQLPDEATDLFGWLLGQDRTTLIRLVTFCAAQSIDAVRGKQDRIDAPRLCHADELAAALGLDMALWWSPTRDSYLGRVSKVLILEAVKDGVSAQAAENLSGLKKEVLIDRAAQKLSGRGWLPPILRPAKQPEAEADVEMMAMAAE